MLNIPRSAAVTRHKKNGFTILEVLVTLAIIAIMVAVMLPSISSRIRTSNSANLGQNLKAINDAIQKYRENVGYYPKQLVYLSARPSSSPTDACGATLSTTNINLWKGPYVSIQVTASGLQSGDAVIQNSLTRIPTTTSSSTVMDGELDINATSVATDVATDIEGTLDAGAADFTTGTVRWSSTTQTLTYVMPISGC